jgi:hypothetical protein
LNLSNQTTLEVGVAPLNLGNAYNAALGAAPAQEDVTFQVSTTDGRLLDGLVEYTGPLNDLTLLIDPETGDGRMQNLSSFIDPFEITAYRILSESGALSVEGWTSFADTGAAGEGWTEANPLATAITELNVSGSTVFSNGTAISLGSIFTPGSALDVALEFATIGGELRSGTVEYASLVGDPSDCNGDGLVDISDANCTPANQLDAFLMDQGFIKGDADGSGEVQFPDFVILANNFGNPGQYTDGDFDKDGLVQFPDFVILADNFGQSAGAAAAVPEPSTALLGLVGLMGLVARYRWWARSFR